MKQICGDCLHYNACAAWNIGSLANADAGNCINFEHIHLYDSVEVVRCKDCELWGRTLSEEDRQRCIEFNTDLVCDYWESDGLMPNDYCSKGERRER